MRRLNQTAYGTIQTPPDADGWGTVLVGDATLVVWFDPRRFLSDDAVRAGWPTPAAGDRAAVNTARLQGDPLKAEWVIGRGTPTYVPPPS